jgi:hypothetical protein
MHCVCANLQVSTLSLPHDREPCEIKVVSNHTCSLHTCVCSGSRRVRVRLSGFRRQGISSTSGGFLKCPFPVQVCAEQHFYAVNLYSLHYSYILCSVFKGSIKFETKLAGVVYCMFPMFHSLRRPKKLRRKTVFSSSKKLRRIFSAPCRRYQRGSSHS